MIKILLSFTLLTCAVSCNTSSTDTYSKTIKEQHITTIENRLDSLIQALSENKQEKSPTTKKKTGKRNIPGTEYYSVPISEPVQLQSEPKKIIPKQTVSEQTSYSSQCAATTKKGTRCKRSVRSGNYCWQHGG